MKIVEIFFYTIVILIVIYIILYFLEDYMNPIEIIIY